MTRPVRLVFFTQTVDGGTCLQTREILDELGYCARDIEKLSTAGVVSCYGG